MYETITRAMSTTLANHNDIFLVSLTNSLKESLGTGVQSRGPTYSNHNTGPRRNDATATNVTPGLNGQASGGVPIQQGSVSAQQGGNEQHSMQQPMVDYSVCQSAVKIAPGYKRIVRDFNAPPYQGKVAQGEIPLGYHYASDFYTLNAIENPGYQNVPQGTQGSGQQS
jgi:hypothetical protein